MTEWLPFVKPSVLAEIRTCELIKKSPSPHVAKYLGCEVQGIFVTGIYYERYIELYDKPQPWKVDKYIADARKGIEHLHSLGLSHNDIIVDHIMLKDYDTGVLIDFDACRPVGEKLVKWGTKGFCREGTQHSHVDNDWYGLEKTKQYMYEWRDDSSRHSS